MQYKLLQCIKNPDDLKKLNQNQIPELCGEIRDCILDTVSKNGGHLASNLGSVELTVALHRVFSAPQDAIIFDVGHQCYAHKLLTGRFDNFSTLRTENGISGFMRPTESVYDAITTGHSSNSISAAYGIYKAKSVLGEEGTAVAVVGDGALTGGMAYEALNNAGDEKGNFIVVLNDNEMSISKNVGSLAKYLTVIRSRPNYYKFKDGFSDFLLKIPFLGNSLYRGFSNLKLLLKDAIYNSNFFEDLGFHYLGPVDGHDEKKLEEILQIAKAKDEPVIVHVMTVKGKGYKFAEETPNNYHGVSAFDLEKGVTTNKSEDFSSCFGTMLCELAEKDSKICAITAAMKVSTGLYEFSKKYSDRFFDVGIAEQHAVTFATGLAKGGMRPVFAVYSSFLQRGFDQVIHDAAIANVPLTICVDRAGFVGEDGETHQGVFDAAFLSQIPNVKIYAPSNYNELKVMLKKAIYEDGVSVVRYPRGKEYSSDNFAIDADYSLLGSGKNAVITYGRLVSTALSAAKETNVAVIKLNVINPLSDSLKDELKKYKKIFFFEEGIKKGGIGEHLGQLLHDAGIKCEYKNIAVDDTFISSATVNSQLTKYLLDADSMIKIIKGE
ncbi:MAG: 1-deoxy-D-xylulose-5-phosphate synthase [Acutalibacteraceae bacterium]|nr:1-deoxy-D-xylulose-5-phosphate synthase [Acutalibacteraceae bacterium]